MKSANATSSRRPYRQGARAEAAAATHRRILQTFLGLLQDRWLEDVTLDEIARESKTTVQTVIRRFRGKKGLLEASANHLEEGILSRRGAAVPGAVRKSIDVLVDDYERNGDLVVQLLAQEPRHGALRPILARGRATHRAWVARVFEPWLRPLRPADRERRLNALIVTTDVYTWKLLRRDLKLGRSVAAELMTDLASGLLGPAPTRQGKHP